MAEEKKKVSLEEQWAQSNIGEYEIDELIDMVNATSGESDWPTSYPDANFSRTLAYKYVERKGEMVFVGHSVVVPKDATMRTLIDTFMEKKLAEAESASAGTEVVPIEIGKKTERRTLSAEAEVMRKWCEFTSDVTNKSDYLTAALAYFMEKYDEGKVDVQFVGKKKK